MKNKTLTLLCLICSFSFVYAQDEFFDDFEYNSVNDPNLVEMTWTILNEDAYPGPGFGAVPYLNSNIKFITDPFGSNETVMSLSTYNTGRAHQLTQSRIQSDHLFFEGSYAAKVRFTDDSQNYEDGNLQTFYTIFEAEADPAHSEHDFEYLPYDTWQGGGDGLDPTLYLSSHERYNMPNEPFFINAHTDVAGSQAGEWHILQFNIHAGAVKFYIDGALIDTHTNSTVPGYESESVYPDSKMRLAFANWMAVSMGQVGGGRTNTFYTDWVYHIQNVDMSYTEILSTVADFQNDDISRLNTLDSFQDACAQSLLNYEGNDYLSSVYVDGAYTANFANPSPNEVNNSSEIASYIRNGSVPFDVAIFSSPFIDATSLENGSRKLLIDIMTDAPIGTELKIQLENQQMSTQGFPNGRRSDFTGATTKTNEWETIELSFNSIIDGSTPIELINQVSLFLDPFSNNSNTYYFDNIRWDEPGCNQTIITGETTVYEGSTTSYTLSGDEHTNIVWTIPLGATILSGQNTTTIEVKWGGTEGTVSVSVDEIIVDPLNIKVIPVLSISGSTTGLEGANSLYSCNSSNYYSTYTWKAPALSSIVNGQGTSTADLLFGSTTGYISIEVNTALGILKDSILITITEDPSNCINLLSDFEVIDLLEFNYASSTDYDESHTNPETNNVINSSQTVARYVRNQVEQFDVLIYDVATISSSDLESGNRSLKLDIYTTAPIGTEIRFQLENQDLAALGYPNGRRARYSGYTTVKNAWESLEIPFVNTIDTNTPVDDIDRLTILLSPGQFTGHAYYIDNIRIEKNSPLCEGIVGIDKQTIQNLDLYPNPFHDRITIDVYNEHKIDLITIYDLQGTTLLTSRQLTNQQIDLSSLEEGTYIIEVHTGNEITRKLIQRIF